MGHSCRTLLSDTVARHSCGTLLWDTHAGHSVGRAQSPAPATTCDLRHTSHPHDSLRLPRKSHFHASKHAQSPAPATKSENIISCELQHNLHHTTRLECFRPVLNPLPSTKIAISSETCHENRASMPHPETQIPMARPHPTPQKHDSPNANPNGTAEHSAHLTKRCTCAAKRITFLARHVLLLQIPMD